MRKRLACRSPKPSPCKLGQPETPLRGSRRSEPNRSCEVKSSAVPERHREAFSIARQSLTGPTCNRSLDLMRGRSKRLRDIALNSSKVVLPQYSSSPASAAHSVSVSVSIVGTAPSRRKSPVDKGEQALGFVGRFAPDVGQERHSAQFLQLLANELEDGLLVEFHSGFRKLARDARDKRSGALRGDGLHACPS